MRDGRTVINVGAGTGSWEPADRYADAIEPSPRCAPREPRYPAPGIDAHAEALPFDDDTFDAALAVSITCTRPASLAPRANKPLGSLSTGVHRMRGSEAHQYTTSVTYAFWGIYTSPSGRPHRPGLTVVCRGRIGGPSCRTTQTYISD